MRRKSSSGVLIPIILHKKNHPANMAEWQLPTPSPFILMPEQKPSKRLFLSQAASCTHRRYLRLSFPPPDGSELPIPVEELLFHRQGVSFKHLRKTTEFWGLITNYRTFKKFVKKKINYFHFFCWKTVKRRSFTAFSAIIFSSAGRKTSQNLKSCQCAIASLCYFHTNV